jgi:hypothetical protein
MTFIDSIKHWIFNIGGVFIIWILLHFTAANLYARFCAELSLIGFIKSIFVAEAPHCIAMRWVIYNGGATIHTMWISIGVWFTGKIFQKMISREIIEK